MTIALDNATPCVKFASLFQNPLLEDENSVETAAEVRTQAALAAHAAKLCGDNEEIGRASCRERV